MKWILGNVLAFVICSVSNVQSFEVKVLLQKSLFSDIKQTPLVIKSDNGFVVGVHPTLSVGVAYSQKTISIDMDNNKLLINGKIQQLPCYINPLLSLKHQKVLLDLVTDWFNREQSVTEQQSQQLNSFFDTFVENKSIVDKKLYNVLTKYTHDVFVAFMTNCVQNLGEGVAVLSLQTLQGYIDDFLFYGVKEKFLNKLAFQEISKKDRKLLHQDLQFRHDFFNRQLQSMVLDLLKEFILVLPRNFLAQCVSDEVGYLNFHGNNYLGSLILSQDAHNLYVINCLDIDDYLLSVIHHEGWPGWSLEVNKILAITCRTYLVWQVLQAQKLKRLYHIENGIRHQSYKGHHKFVELKKAIEETRDVCIAYDNKPILAMFDCCCGGVIPADINHPDYQKYPYLLRTSKCTFCKDFKVATWKASFLHDNFVAVLQKAFPHLQTIDDIFTKKDKAGLVTKVSILTQPKTLNLTGKKMYSLFPEIRSFCFDIENCSKKVAVKGRARYQKKNRLMSNNQLPEKCFVISGRGYGHHMGLCQWGAMKLIRDYHWKYQDVLQFYYPGTNLIKLIYQR